VHGHADAPASPDEHIRRSPASALGSPPIDHENGRRGDLPQIASTRRGADPRRVERTHYQPHGGMLNGSRGVTISGGVFLYIQGNVHGR
jgi:hypothetical protein